MERIEGAALAGGGGGFMPYPETRIEVFDVWQQHSSTKVCHTPACAEVVAVIT